MNDRDVALLIGHRFNGPPDSGNGGYAAGLIAGAIGERVKVRLQKPLPLDRGLVVTRVESDKWGVQWHILDQGDHIATASPADVPLEAPPPVAYLDALAATTHYAGFHGHLYPTCFVCGPDRARGDGLRIFPSAVTGRDVVAAPWMPDASLCDGSGKVLPEFVWAALDCPGYFAAAPVGRPALLGEYAVHVARLVHLDEPCVVIGWRLSTEGRKHRAGTALFDEDGELCAVGHATWISLLGSAAS